MTKYTLGFMFSPELDRVVMVKKKRPKWQSGKFNGVGGHLEDSEGPEEGMAREFLEECGIDTAASNWRRYAGMRGNDFSMDCFLSKGNVDAASTMTDEEVVVLKIKDIVEGRIEVCENTTWLILLALDVAVDGRPNFVTIHYP